MMTEAEEEAEDVDGDGDDGSEWSANEYCIAGSWGEASSCSLFYFLLLSCVFSPPNGRRQMTRGELRETGFALCVLKSVRAVGSMASVSLSPLLLLSSPLERMDVLFWGGLRGF